MYSNAIGAAAHFATPSAGDGAVFVAANTHVYSFVSGSSTPTATNSPTITPTNTPTNTPIPRLLRSSPSPSPSLLRSLAEPDAGRHALHGRLLQGRGGRHAAGWSIAAQTPSQVQFTVANDGGHVVQHGGWGGKLINASVGWTDVSATLRVKTAGWGYSTQEGIATRLTDYQHYLRLVLVGTTTLELDSVNNGTITKLASVHARLLGRDVVYAAARRRRVGADRLRQRQRADHGAGAGGLRQRPGRHRQFADGVRRRLGLVARQQPDADADAFPVAQPVTVTIAFAEPIAFSESLPFSESIAFTEPIAEPDAGRHALHGRLLQGRGGRHARRLVNRRTDAVAGAVHRGQRRRARGAARRLGRQARPRRLRRLATSGELRVKTAGWGGSTQEGIAVHLQSYQHYLRLVLVGTATLELDAVDNGTITKLASVPFAPRPAGVVHAAPRRGRLGTGGLRQWPGRPRQRLAHRVRRRLHHAAVNSRRRECLATRARARSLAANRRLGTRIANCCRTWRGHRASRDGARATKRLASPEKGVRLCGHSCCAAGACSACSPSRSPAPPPLPIGASAAILRGFAPTVTRRADVAPAR